MEELIKGASLVTTFTIPESSENVHTIGKPNRVVTTGAHPDAALPSTASGADWHFVRRREISTCTGRGDVVRPHS